MNENDPRMNGSLAGIAESSVADVFESFVTSEEGIHVGEAAARLQRFGRNRLPRPDRLPWFVELAREFCHLFAILLWIAAILAWWVGMPQLAIAVIVVILVNGLFSYWQQYKAEHAVEALESLLPRQVQARREGKEVTIDAEGVTLGDVLILREGVSIPADARLVRAEGLRVDASALTGESRPVSRNAEPCASRGKLATEMSNLVLAGTFVVSGHGEAVVIATGGRTEFGRLAALTHAQPTRESPLQREMTRVTRVVTLLAVGMGIAFFAIGWGSGRLTPLEGFVFALGIIVANVPEGLLPTISLSLAIGVRRMAARNAIVKRLERVEALGAVTVIVTDKTGTLTHNQMTVREVWCDGKLHQISGGGYEPKGMITLDGVPSTPDDAVTDLLRTAALCCDARLGPPDAEHPYWRAIGDPTEAALLVAARKGGLPEPLLDHYPRVAELPFDSVRKRMTTVHRTDQGLVACMKGAAHEVLPRCVEGAGIAKEAWLSRRVEAELAARHLADRGLRVLAVASRHVVEDEDLASVEFESRMTFLGLLAMEDPPRAEVRSAIGSCRAAGIRTIMATGDDGHTAAAIGREIELHGDKVHVVTGEQLDLMGDRALGLLLGDRNVIFSRVSPAHKLRLVETLQKRGEVVAVTGDGVNDAPALKLADVGVAMGGRGTDVARAAADVVLLDDNFATIVAAIEEGRAVYENVRKFVTYILASNVPEIVPFLAFVLFRIPLPLTVMQILAVDLGTDLFPALALGMEPPEPGLMHRPPRARSSPLLDHRMLLRAYGWLGAIEAIMGLSGFFFVYILAGWRFGEPMADAGPLYAAATTMSLSGIVACQLGNGLACRSEATSLITLGVFGNKPLLFAMLVEVLALIGLIYVPALANIFQLERLSPAHWGVLALFGPLLLLAEEVRKHGARRRKS